MTSSIPIIAQCSPYAAYMEHRVEVDASIQRVLTSQRYILGPETQAFEAEFAQYCGCADAIGVASGTDGLTLALRALGIGPGMRVATVSHTAVATVAAIALTGAEPLLVDIGQDNYVMCSESLARALAAYGGHLIRAIIPVHLYGEPAPMAEILKVIKGRDIVVLEDASQAHGARVDMNPGSAAEPARVGTIGDAAAFSLYPTKNLGALGDAGIITTCDRALAARMRELREYGWKQRYISATAGMNSRLDELQAAVLRVKLRWLTVDNTRRRAIADQYRAVLEPRKDLLPPIPRAGVEHVFHQYVIDTIHPDRRKRFGEHLTAAGIQWAIHYPLPVHQQPAYAGVTPIAPGGLPNTERRIGTILSLPMFPQLTDEEVQRVCEAIRTFPEEVP